VAAVILMRCYKDERAVAMVVVVIAKIMKREMKEWRECVDVGSLWRLESRYDWYHYNYNHFIIVKKNKDNKNNNKNNNKKRLQW
jgi:hypothetical protein